jgi:hypothetical protein
MVTDEFKAWDFETTLDDLLKATEQQQSSQPLGLDIETHRLNLNTIWNNIMNAIQISIASTMPTLKKMFRGDQTQKQKPDTISKARYHTAKLSLLAQQLTDYTTNPTVLDRRKLMEWNHRFAKYNDDYNSGAASEDMSIDNTKVVIPDIDDHTCLKTWLNIFKEAIKH